MSSRREFQWQVPPEFNFGYDAVDVFAADRSRLALLYVRENGTSERHTFWDFKQRSDRFANALSAVPEAEQCGWLKDRFGVSWQIVPRQLIRLIGDADRARAKRAFEAMMEMKRIDIAALERAADGVAPSP